MAGCETGGGIVLPSEPKFKAGDKIRPTDHSTQFEVLAVGKGVYFCRDLWRMEEEVLLDIEHVHKFYQPVPYFEVTVDFARTEHYLKINDQVFKPDTLLVRENDKHVTIEATFDPHIRMEITGLPKDSLTDLTFEIPETEDVDS